MAFLSDNQITLISKAFVLLLFAFVAASSYFVLQTGGAFAIVEVLVSLYVVSVVVLAVFREGFHTRRFRIALYVGIIAWGLVSYVGGNQTIVTLVLLVLGALLLTRELTFGDD